MKYISGHPIVALSFFILLYYLSVVFLFDTTSFGSKFTFFLIAFFVFIIVLLIGFAFRLEMKNLESLFFSVFISGKFQKANILKRSFYVLVLGSVPFFITTIFEFLFTELFTSAGIVTIGFPLPVYSFSATRILFMNIIINITLYSLILYFVGSVVSRNSGTNGDNLPT